MTRESRCSRLHGLALTVACELGITLVHMLYALCDERDRLRERLRDL